MSVKQFKGSVSFDVKADSYRFKNCLYQNYAASASHNTLRKEQVSLSDHLSLYA